MSDQLRQAIWETAMEWTRLHDRAVKSNYVTDTEAANRCGIALRGLCRKLRKAEKPTVELLKDEGGA